MKFKQYVDITEIIKKIFGDDKYAKQKFATYRKVQLNQVNRWIEKNAHILDGDVDGIIFVKAKTHKQKEK